MDPVKPRLATVWLGGCSGSHMSFLDLDEALLDLAARVSLVYSPIADVKRFPEQVDIALVEGPVVNREQIEEVRRIRERTRVLIAFGDCAVTGNISTLRNSIPLATVVGESYPEGMKFDPVLPKLLNTAVPLQEVVHINHYLPGCPPSAAAIAAQVQSLLAGEGLTEPRRFG